MDLWHLYARKTVSDHSKVEVRSRNELRAWLEAHHRQSESIWLAHYKKGSDHYLPFDEIVAEAICWGWIDSLPRKLDDNRTMHRLSPRRAGSNWSARNKCLAEAAIRSGRMSQPGQQAIDRAKKDGSWNALDDIEADVIPSDLLSELERHGAALSSFKAFPKSVRRGILEWIDSAKTRKTREARIANTAQKAARGEQANQFR